MISKEKKKGKTTVKGGFGSKWTPDIRNFLIGIETEKVESGGPILPFKKGKSSTKISESQNQEGGGVGDIEFERESLLDKS